MPAWASRVLKFSTFCANLDERPQATREGVSWRGKFCDHRRSGGVTKLAFARRDCAAGALAWGLHRI
jgi:hypothetical protein